MFKGTVKTRQGRLQAWTDSLLQDHAVFRLFWHNLAEVIPGKVWRSNHPTPGRLRRWRQHYGFQSVINLRGQRQCGSDVLGRDAAKQMGLPYHDMAFESRNAPHKDRILRFHALYLRLKQEGAFPLLLHCKSGADRAALGSGLVILFEGGSPAQALAQLHWKHLHFKSSRTGILDSFFKLYAQEAAQHADFMSWLQGAYDEQRLRDLHQAGALRI
ncbi:protein tyrosine phosphatase [Formicincola oecophyllae]|uniref:Protein tyrosine phosphatase n=1 Tax=Formicincola oecophyllae TaxID=2558361 RepID=A0A4Y6UB38_9PROT|nr:protein tyrosine phosphatase [Formicincola oecophyllae]QDH13611.1 protein tyrosine phosphatase [Formicincola oecophyllae]